MFSSYSFLISKSSILSKAFSLINRLFSFIKALTELIKVFLNSNILSIYSLCLKIELYSNVDFARIVSPPFIKSTAFLYSLVTPNPTESANDNKILLIELVKKKSFF